MRRLSRQMAPTGGNCGLLLALLAFSSWLQIAQRLWRHRASNTVRGVPKQRRKRRQPFSLERGRQRICSILKSIRKVLRTTRGEDDKATHMRDYDKVDILGVYPIRLLRT
uniref:Uncharacterized protein n=1 Tax=Vespula pensylvanica TaxID=30213 RepID=A0A834PF09_VESPE|nr:hypothetical protein H0235_001004 [Vespula pensylvanica]